MTEFMSERIAHPDDSHRTTATFIGIDVGGTKIAAGLVDAQTGTLRAWREIRTDASRGGEAVLEDVIGLAHALAGESHCGVAGIGVGVCELVDPAGEVQSAHTVAWQGLPVQARLSQIAPARVESDVRAHALAEACFGAGSDYALFVFITVGTGISSCIVQDRVPLAGARGNALVMASSPLAIPMPGENGTEWPRCHGKYENFHEFILEEYASGPALLARYAAATGQSLAHGRELFDRASTGDALAARILASGGAALGNSIAFLVNVIDPEAVIIGGGLGMADGIYWQEMEAAARRAIYAEKTRGLPIQRAQLGAEAGIIGAALSAHQWLKNAG